MSGHQVTYEQEISPKLQNPFFLSLTVYYMIVNISLPLFEGVFCRNCFIDIGSTARVISLEDGNNDRVGSNPMLLLLLRPLRPLSSHSCMNCDEVLGAGRHPSLRKEARDRKCWSNGDCCC